MSASSSAPSSLSSTISTRERVGSRHRIGRAPPPSGARVRRRPRQAAQTDGELGAVALALAAARTPSRRAARRGCARSPGPARARPASARATAAPARTGRRSVGSMSASMPMPVSRTDHDDFLALGAPVDGDASRRARCTSRRWSAGWRPPARGAPGSACTASPVARHVDAQIVALLLEQRARHLDGRARRRRRSRPASRRSSTLPRVMRETSSRSSTSADQVLDLALDDAALALGGVHAAQPQQLQRREDRRERVAQLVAEHRQELVLGAVGGFGRSRSPLISRRATT